jgi:hypothetical protein
MRSGLHIVTVRNRDSVLPFTRMGARLAVTGVFVLVVMSQLALIVANWCKNQNQASAMERSRQVFMGNTRPNTSV